MENRVNVNATRDIYVRHLDVVEKIATKGMLKYLKSVEDHCHRGKRVYYFDNIPEVEQAVNTAYTEYKTTHISQKGNK